MEFDVAVENEGFPARVVYVPMVRFAEQDGAFPQTALPNRTCPLAGHPALHKSRGSESCRLIPRRGDARSSVAKTFDGHRSGG